jgi:5-methylcytosine-specific restriction endonuclease McrA
MELLTEEFGGLCAYCDSIAESWDHLMPIAAGGTSRPFNILPACRPCNSSKGTRDALDWIEATGRRLTERFINSIALVERYG